MSAPSSSVWSGRSPRPQSGAHSVANSSAIPNSATSSSAMPNIPTTNNQPVINNGSTMPNISPAPATPQSAPTTSPAPVTPPTPTASQPTQTAPAQPAQPISPSPRRPAGDIILHPSSPDKPNSNKKPLIIGAIALAGATVIAGLIFLVTSTLNNNSAPAGSSLAKFNIYANYILYGEEDSTANINSDVIYDSMTDSKMTIEEFNEKYEIVEEEEEEDEEEETGETITDLDINQEYSEMYWITDIINNPESTEQQIAFFDKASSLFAEFMNSNANNGIQSTVEDNYNNLRFYSLYLENSSIEEADVLTKYIESSPDDTLNYIKDVYEAYTSSGNPIAQEFAKKIIASYDAYVKILNWVNSKGCLSDNGIDETCINDNNYATELASEVETSLNAETEANTIFNDATNNFLNACWEINSALNGGDNNS